MTKIPFVKKIRHPEYGELYQFFDVDAETGKEIPVDPFGAGILREASGKQPPKILKIASKRGAEASGYQTGEKFIVQKGSKFAASTSAKCPKRYIKLREKLLLEKRLIPLHSQLFLLEDYEFDSPMLAMGAVIGGWVKGPHGWQ